MGDEPLTLREFLDLSKAEELDLEGCTPSDIDSMALVSYSFEITIGSRGTHSNTMTKIGD